MNCKKSCLVHLRSSCGNKKDRAISSLGWELLPQRALLIQKPTLRVLDVLFNTSSGHPKQLEYMDLPPHGVPAEPSDPFTRWLFGQIVPLTWQQRFRDGGHARNLVDNLVSLSTVTMLQHIPRFLDVRRHAKEVPYSTDHDRCLLHISDLCNVLDEHCDEESADYWEILVAENVLVFVHGGAWGSGKPWMYQLSAAGKCPYWQLDSHVPCSALASLRCCKCHWRRVF